jgi:hypothetical protein
LAAAVLPDEGLGELLKYLVQVPIVGVVSWELWLWVNNIVPDHATELSMLVEATFGGYQRYTLPREDWTEPVVEGGCAHSTWGEDAIVWPVNATHGETVYGYALVDPSTSIIRLIQRFDPEDISPLVVGRPISMLPEFTLDSHEC